MCPLFFLNIMGRSKYNVDSDKDKRTYDGIVFDSVVEMKYYRDVILPCVGSGKIKLVELQKQFVLQPKFIHEGKNVLAITYVADFYIEYNDGKCEVIDVKGMPDSVAKIKRKMFWYVYPEITYRWVSYSKIDGGWVEYEYLVEQRKKRKKGKQHGGQSNFNKKN